MTSHPHTWWFDFFNHPDYLRIYGGSVDDTRTNRELQFCERVLNWHPGDTVLDAPCGQGRHTRRLAEKGFQVIGIDLSNRLLEIAHNTQLPLNPSGPLPQPNHPQNSPVGADLNVSPSFVHPPLLIRGHLAFLPLPEACVHYAISMFSSFGYGQTEDENMAILAEYARVLRPGGRLLIDVMNRHFLTQFLSPVYRHQEGGVAVREERRIVENGRRLINTITVIEKDGTRRQYPYTPWLYNGWELTLMAQQVGLKPIAVYGDFEARPYSMTSERAMVVAEK